MQLSSQRYATVVTCLRRAAESSGSDKRKFTRMEVQARVSLALLRGGEISSVVFTGLTRDVSMEGMGLFLAMHLESGQQMVVELPTEGEKPMLMICNVRHSRMIANGIFAIGAEFVADAGEDLAGQWTRGKEDETERIRSLMLA
jgi:hypothetical protein